MSGDHELVDNPADSHVYLLAHQADHNFAVAPEQTAFEPALQHFSVAVPVEVLSGEYRIAVIECAGAIRRTVMGEKNTSRLEFSPGPDVTAVILAIRLGGKSAVRLGAPSVRIADLPFDFFEPHSAGAVLAGLGSEAVKAQLRSTLPRVRVQAAFDRVDRFLERQILSLWNQSDVLYAGGGMWTDVDTRAHQRLLHGFVFLAEWAGVMSQSDEHREGVLVAALELLQEWYCRFGSGQAPDAPMAWHDETTAQRVLGVLSLMEACGWTLPEQAVETVRNVLEPAAAALFTDEFHETGNNHGMFQDLALLAYAVLAPYPTEQQRSRMASKALRRLDDYFGSGFTDEGVHVENSPSYHLMASQYLQQYTGILGALGHPRADHFQEMLSRATAYATHAVMPNGMYPPISDTTQRVLGNTVHGRLFDDASYRFAVTAGKDGDPARERSLVLPHSGYAMYRSAWGDPDAAYVFFSAAYNANYHKHSDDLSLFVRHRGYDILCEAGPYGYDYEHPFSKHAYSQFAHNSLVVDGKSLPRTDGKFSAVTLQDDDAGCALNVTGTNARYENVVHRRSVRVREDGTAPTIVVEDVIESPHQHRYELLWHLGPELRSTVGETGFDVRYPGKPLAEVRVESATEWKLSRVRGQDAPHPQGWRFPVFNEAVPAEALCLRFRGKTVRMTTTITLLPAEETASGGDSVVRGEDHFDLPAGSSSQSHP
ncbi:heparinase II/III domain-containing protein [Kocuria sp. U4B]